MELKAIIQRLEPINPFRIARGEKRFVENVFVRLESNGIVGYGEASPNSFYREDAHHVLEKLSGLKTLVAEWDVSSVEDIEPLWHEIWPQVMPSRAAQCAIDLALWDMVGKRNGVSVSQLIWCKNPEPVVSSCTLGICENQDWRGRISEIADYPIIKIKMDHTGDLSFPRAVRSLSKSALRVDANCAWTSTNALDIIKKLHKLDVEFVEQPFSPEKNRHMKNILNESPLPIIADESCRTLTDISTLSGLFSGVNIKLVKCGGLTPALAMLKESHSLGLSVMVGCMLESNLLIAAGSVLAQETEYADLDGSWLLKDRVFKGIDFTKGILTPGSNPGLGVVPPEGFFSKC